MKPILTALPFTDVTLERPPLAEIFEHHACFCDCKLVCAVEWRHTYPSYWIRMFRFALAITVLLYNLS